MKFYKKSQEAGLGRNLILGIIILLIVAFVVIIFITQGKDVIIAKIDSILFS